MNVTKSEVRILARPPFSFRAAEVEVSWFVLGIFLSHPYLFPSFLKCGSMMEQNCYSLRISQDMTEYLDVKAKHLIVRNT